MFAVAAACRTGDAAAMRTLFAANVVAVVDGEGERTGPESVSRLLAETANTDQKTSVSVESVNGQSGLAYRKAGRVVGIAALSIEYGVINRVWLVLAPDKLRQWTRGSFDIEPPQTNISDR
ncbi:hypothetical protein E4P29_03485 [Rhodococcus sp. 1R11]|uniref:hypothetical protein n=1 Tax=Rhodococcus sp. 1R11 TaxID=2559614 RepID=UPI001071CDA2|nr:hypothetical protein [Rhodococcus sp. 1R11]MBY4058092.1 hypothetical protein [Rhodococcus fascians]MBY4069735.1 hypothetical protein [Rhodococcus fascians]TFI44833.1 hypothetical protein E4P29_03485 [Rhodococcus sp. 1R11]